MLGARSTLVTDKASLVPAMRSNAQRNGLIDRVRCAALQWSDSPELPRDWQPHSGEAAGSGRRALVLMSDCLNPVYGREHATALAATLHAILSRCAASPEVEGVDADGAMPMGLLSQMRRGLGEAEATFFDACTRLGLEATLLQRRQLHLSDMSSEHSEAVSEGVGAKAEAEAGGGAAGSAKVQQGECVVYSLKLKAGPVASTP